MNDFYQDIDDFLTNKMSPGKRIEFEKEMEKDPRLRRAVDNHDIVRETLELLVEDDIRQFISNIDSGINPNDYPHTNRRYLGIKTYLLVAAIMFLLALFAYFIKKTQEPDAQLLYAQYYSDHSSLNVRGLNQIPGNLSTCDYGHALMQKEAFNEARNVLELSAKTNDQCTPKSQWLLSLLYLQQNLPAKRDSLLMIVSADSVSPFASKAKELYDMVQ